MSRLERTKPGFVVWFTGLPCSGKTSLSKALESDLKENYQLPVQHIDGDSVRSVFPSIGFSASDRNRHVSQMGFLASMLSKNGVSCVASFVSPYKESRDFCRNICENFIEVHVSTPLEVCEKRDSKGMYRKARAGEILNFTGINDPYEDPTDPEIQIDTSEQEITDSLSIIVDYLKSREFV